MADDLASIQRDLAKLSKRPLSIIKLSEPLLNPASEPGSNNKAKRGSDATPSSSTAAAVEQPSPSPQSLTLDLAHYRELFKKLHFSYLEQVSKEKFLRAIVGEPPMVVEPADNAALERELAAAKADLGAQKAAVAALAADLEARGRDLAARHDAVRLRESSLAELPAEIGALEARIADLERVQRERDGRDGGAAGASNQDARQDPRLVMPLAQTHEAVAQRRDEADRLEREIAALRTAAPARARQVERLEGELRPLESQRAAAEAAAEDARKRKEMRERGISDEVELRGRWHTGANDVLRDVLGVEAK